MKPYRIRKVTRKQCYRVTNSKTKRIFSKCTSRENAKKQVKLLQAIKYNKTFRTMLK